MKRITFDRKIEGKRQAAFVILYTLDCKPWANYPDKPGGKNLVIPTCLMINRSDGRIGFAGGTLQAGETLEQAAAREVEEEIGYKINSLLEQVVCHESDSIATYAFAVELTYDRLRQIQKSSHEADHCGSEITGLFLPHLIDYDGCFGKGGGITHLLKSPLAPSVREELVHFLLNKKIFSKKELEDICKKCGYNLETLLN